MTDLRVDPFRRVAAGLLIVSSRAPSRRVTSPLSDITGPSPNLQPTSQQHHDRDLRDHRSCRAHVVRDVSYQRRASASRQLNLAGDPYAALVNVPSAQRPGAVLVIPGDPESSYLVRKLEGRDINGLRMPRNGPPYLTDGQIPSFAAGSSSARPETRPHMRNVTLDRHRAAPPARAAPPRGASRSRPPTRRAGRTGTGPGRRQAGRRPRSRSLAAGLHADRAADDAADPAVRQLVPGDPPLHAAARPGRLRRSAVGRVRHRQRRADRSRVPLRHLQRHAGRRAPHERSDDPVLRAAERAAAGTRLCRSASTRSAADRGHATTSATATRRPSARSISRELGRHGAIYAQPIWVNNTNQLPSELVDDNSTFIIGFGARLRVRPTVYVVAEAAPRFGFGPDVAHVSFAIEKRAGGHSFQLNFSNGFGTTLAQVARGGISNDNWYFGFNISRKFF